MPLTDFGVNYLRDRAIRLANDCHDSDTGKFCGDGDERYFGDYKMEHIKPDMASGLHRIVATLGDTEVAQMQWSQKQIEGLDVADDHQRKGIARAMWEWGQTMRPRPKHSNDRTTQGDLWAKSIGGKIPRRKPEPPPFEYAEDTETLTPANQEHDTGTQPEDGSRTHSGSGVPSASELRADATDENAFGIPDRSSHLCGTPAAPEAMEFQIAEKQHALSNSCHDSGTGRFCETHGGVHTLGFDDTWPPKRVEAMAARARNLVKEYGIPITLDARPSDPGNHDNLAHINGVMAGVGINDPGTIHINPKLIDTEYLREQFGAGTTRAKSVSDIITHEYGHILEDTLAERKEWDIIHEVRDQFTQAIGDDGPVQFDRNRLRMEVSFYAGKNDHEGVAESFLAYKQGHHNDWTTKVGQAFDRYFKKEV